MTTYTKKAAFGFLFLSLGALGAGTFGYLLRLLLARTLGPEEYGLVYAVMALFGLTYAIQQLGMGQAISKYVAGYKVRENFKKIREAILVATIIVTIMSAIIALVGFGLSEWLALNYFRLEGSGALVRIYSLAVFLTIIPMIIPPIFQGLQKMGLSSLFQFMQSFLLLITTGILLYMGYGAFGALAAYSIVFVLLLIFFLPLTVKEVPKLLVPMKIKWKPTKKMLLFGFPVMFSFLASLVMTQIDTVLLTFFQPLLEVGLYQTAVPTANIVMMFGVPVATILLPMGSELWARKEKELLKQALRETYVYVFMLALPVILSLLVFPDVILNLLFGGEYVGAAFVLQLLAVAMLVSVLNLVNSSILSGIGKPGHYARAVGYAAILNVVANLILIPRYAGVGAAIATLISIAAIFLLTIGYLKKDVNFNLPLIKWAKTILAGAGFLIVVILFRQYLSIGLWPKVVLAVAAASIVYCMLIIFTKAMTLSEIKNLVNRILTKSS